MKAPLADAVIPAAGVGKRMGASVPKQYLKLCGLCVLERTLKIFLSHPAIAHVVVALGEHDPFFDSLGVSRHPKIVRAVGGNERADSVLNGLKLVTSPYVLVHDAARPLLSRRDLDALLQAGFEHPDGALLAQRMADTVKEQNAAGLVERTVPRKMLWRALTPQMFETELLRRVLGDALAAGKSVTDDASAVELAGGHPLLVEGLDPNFKLTEPSDFTLAEALLSHKENSSC